VPPPYVNRGAVYIFAEPASGWTNMTESAKLTAASDGAVDDGFGSSLALSGNTLVVGAPRATGANKSQQGAAYLFTKPVGGWANMTQSGEFAATDGAAYDRLGTSVAIGGEILSGSPNSDTGRGATYAFAAPTATAFPTITSTAPTAAHAGQRLTYQVKTSAAAGTKMTYALRAAPAGMSIDTSTGLLTWLPSVLQAGSNAVTIVATDSLGNVCQQSFSILVARSVIYVPIGPIPKKPKITVVDQLFSNSLGQWWRGG
jgi:hypothetical protein